MRAHLVCRWSGIAVPDAAARVLVAGIPSVAADRAAPVQLVPQALLEPAARAAEMREHDHTRGSATDPEPAKVFRALQAECDLEGHCLCRTCTVDGPAQSCLARCGMVRELQGLASLAKLLDPVGVAHV